MILQFIRLLINLSFDATIRNFDATSCDRYYIYYYFLITFYFLWILTLSTQFALCNFVKNTLVIKFIIINY